MFASFHSKGTLPSCSDMLKTCASGVLICSTVSFSILGDIPSTPGPNTIKKSGAWIGAQLTILCSINRKLISGDYKEIGVRFLCSV